MPATTRGRPRGSGRVQGVPPIPLTTAENGPFQLGRRIAETWPHVAARWTGELHDLVIYATPAERRALLVADHGTWAKWAGIGIAYGQLANRIKIARGE